ncbi:MAG: BMC domain-containing protein [Enterococcus malodoratus]
MDAIGFIETRGLIPAIEAADVMLKSAQVGLVERSIVGGGIVTVTVTGDVGAVKAAVDAGASTVKGFGSENLLSQHVIPRPSEQVSDVIFEEKQMPVISQEQDSADAEKKVLPKPETEELETDLEQKSETKPESELDVPKVEQPKVKSDPTIKEDYKELNVKELRKLAKKYDNLGMTNEELQTATRAVLREQFEKYKNK